MGTVHEQPQNVLQCPLFPALSQSAIPFLRLCSFLRFFCYGAGVNVTGVWYHRALEDRVRLGNTRKSVAAALQALAIENERNR